ncbi:MAG: type II toxin-antitoxin system PemK/MazF family toxin [Steroidobacteraceae bacterium]
MASFEQGDVIKVPFPYTDRSMRQFRPALVVSIPEVERRHGLLWVVMITSAQNRGWPDDLSIPRLAEAGLPVASVIRPAKIATIDAAQATRLGRIPSELRARVLRRVGGMIGT